MAVLRYASLCFLATILLLPFTSRPVSASDDSNTMQLSTVSTLTAGTLNVTLDELSQQLNDTMAKQMIHQFENQLSNGNYTAAQDSLSQLKNYLNMSKGSALSSSLRDLIQNLQVGANGATFDWGTPPTASTVDQSSLQSALSSMSKNVNDPNFTQLLNLFKSQLASGDNLGAFETLKQLKNYSDSREGGMIPASLKDLLHSMNVGSDGASVDWNGLSSLLGANGANSLGVPSGLAGMDPSKAAQDLSALAKLSAPYDSSLSSILGDESLQIGQALGGVSNTGAPPGFSAQIPNLSSPGSLPISASQLPAIGGVSALPQLNIGLQPTLLIVLGIVAIMVTMIILRKKVRIRQKVPGPNPPQARDPLSGLDLRDPKQAIIYYFRKMVRVMGRRGVLRYLFETHRDFSAKCSPRPEAESVERLSSLYEKAMFSGHEVTSSDSTDANKAFSVIEQSKPSTGKKKVWRAMLPHWKG